MVQAEKNLLSVSYDQGADRLKVTDLMSAGAGILDLAQGLSDFPILCTVSCLRKRIPCLGWCVKKDN